MMHPVNMNQSKQTQINRRSFLKGLGILGAAPAIVKAENIMKIWTPPKDIILPQSIDFMVPKGQPGFYTLCFHINDGNEWKKHIQHVYLDGKTDTVSFPYQFKKVPKLSITGVQLETQYERPVITSNTPITGYRL